MSIDGGPSQLRPSDIVLPPKIDLVIPKAFIGELHSEDDPRKRQNILDRIFTNDRREQMIATASKDSKDRPVRYFRKQKYDKLLQLLDKGSQDHSDYFADPNEPIDESTYQHFMNSYGRRLGIDYAQLSGLSTDQLEDLVFAKAPPQQRAHLRGNKGILNVSSFVDRNVPLDFIQDMHTGSLTQKLSPLLSLSVGGVIDANPFPKKVYLELVMPDSQVIPHQPEHGVEGEKEVFTRRIGVENVSRVYVDVEALWKDEITNPNTPIGQYNQKYHSGTEAVERWRWDEKTVDYLPKALINK